MTGNDNGKKMKDKEGRVRGSQAPFSIRTCHSQPLQQLRVVRRPQPNLVRENRGPINPSVAVRNVGSKEDGNPIRGLEGVGLEVAGAFEPV